MVNLSYLHFNIQDTNYCNRHYCQKNTIHTRYNIIYRDPKTNKSITIQNNNNILRSIQYYLNVMLWTQTETNAAESMFTLTSCNLVIHVESVNWLTNQPMLNSNI